MSIEESDVKYFVKEEEIQKLVKLEVAKDRPESACIIRPDLTNNRALALNLYADSEDVNGGHRAEISIDFPYKQGETVAYQWRFMIPEDFAADDPANRTWLMGQWHDQPDPNKGETWENYPAHSPVVGLYYGRIDGQDFLSLEGLSIPPDKKNLIPIKRGHWNKIMVIIYWSMGSYGSVTVKCGHTIMHRIGPNMYNTLTHYIKLGMYRYRDIKTDNTIYIDSIKIRKVSL